MAAARAEVACLTTESSKYQEDALIEVSHLQARVEAVERKAAEHMDAAKAIALSKYQSLAEFKQVCRENYDEGVWAFMYNVWHKHPE